MLALPSAHAARSTIVFRYCAIVRRRSDAIGGFAAASHANVGSGGATDPPVPVPVVFPVPVPTVLPVPAPVAFPVPVPVVFPAPVPVLLPVPVPVLFPAPVTPGPCAPPCPTHPPVSIAKTTVAAAPTRRSARYAGAARIRGVRPPAARKRSSPKTNPGTLDTRAWAGFDASRALRTTLEHCSV